jgi:protein-disulfide isomerase
MKEKLVGFKKQGFNLLITLLLSIQVILSVFISMKLTKFEKAGLVLNQDIPQSPQYIEDVSIDDDPMIGNPKSSVIVIEFGDYQCPFCKESERSIKRILDEYKEKIAFVYRDFPLDSHPYAYNAAIASNCANEQGYFWEVRDLLYEYQEDIKGNDSLLDLVREIPFDHDKFRQCLLDQKYKNEILNDIEDGKKYQVNGVPTFFINGYHIEGGSYEQIKLLIEQQMN